MVDFVTASPWTYAILLGVVAGDALFPVLPSEASAIAAGLLAERGKLDLPLVVLVASAGAIIGDNTSYWLGRTLGEPAARRLLRGARGQRRLEWARRLLRERGGTLIVVARFIPGGRTATTFTAGVVRYSWPKFLGLTFFAGAVWGTYAVLLGYLGGRTFEERPWLGLAVAFGIAAGLGVTIEGIRRLRERRGA